MVSIITRYAVKNHIYFGYRSLFLSSSSLSSKSIILGIESSCDDTGCAIINSDRQVLGEFLASQQAEVSRFGGVLPVVAEQFHLKNIDVVVKNALQNASMTVNDIDAIAVTTQPGMALSLLVGLNYAKELSKRFEKRFIPIHHMEAHALVSRLIYFQDLTFPYLTFLISGGHCLLAIVYSVRKFVLLGKSMDDAPGEAFDKIARRLKIYNVPKYRYSSGGAAIENAARLGNPLAFACPEPLRHRPNCIFSFAGMKSHIFRIIAKEEKKYDIAGDEVVPNLADICASFQFVVAQHLCRRLQRAMEFIDRREMLPKNNRKLVVSGGVACNSYLLSAFGIICEGMDYTLIVPPLKYCSDNGVMIAWNGMEKYRENIDILSHHEVDEIIVESDSPLGEDATEVVWKAAIKCEWIKLDKLHDIAGDDNSETQKSNVEKCKY